MKARLTVSNDSDNFEKCWRKFKKKVNNSGKLRDVRARTQYEKPSEKKKTARARARSRWLKSEKCVHGPNYK